MASTLKHLRSSTADKRPTGSGLSDGQIAINTASGTPGLFVKDNAGDIVKIGPAHVGTVAPNAVPAGSTGNSKGEMWVDENLTTRGLKYYDGTNFVNLTPSGTSTTIGLVQLATNAETQAGTVSTKAVTPSGLQSKVSDSISTTSSTVLASATAVKTAYDLANAALPKGGGTVSGVLEIGSTGTFQFDGSSADANKTILAVVNPTANRTITLPNVTGTVVTTGDSGTVTSTMIADSTIVNADINASAAIVDTKLATISTAGKVSNSATTATNANTASAIVARDGSGNFSASTITASGILSTGTVTAASLNPTGSSVPTNGVYLPAANSVGISTNGTGRLFVDANGVISIGASSNPNATARFGVTGGVAALLDLYRTGVAGEAQLNFYNENSFSAATVAGRVAGLLTDATAGFEAGSLLFATNFQGSVGERVRITSVGRVGIGTTSPATPLDVNGDVTITDKIIHSGDTNTAIRFPADDTVTIETAGSERARITSAGLVGIGTTSPNRILHIVGGDGPRISHSTSSALNSDRTTTGGESRITFNNTVDGKAAQMRINWAQDSLGAFETWVPSNTSNGQAISFRSSIDNTIFYGSVASTERARIDSSGRLLVGTSSTPPAVESIIPQFVSSSAGSSNAAQDIAIYNYQNASGSGRGRVGPKLFFGNSRSGTNGAVGQTIGSTDLLGNIRFAGDDGTKFVTGAEILAEVDGIPGANDMPGRLVFSTTADGASSPTERMRIDNSGKVFFGKTSTDNNVVGLLYDQSGVLIVTRSGNVPLILNRTTNDGTVADFRTSNTTRGTISISGSTTSYNTTSDYRLKENVVPLTGAIDRLQQIPVHRFNFLADPDTVVDGFIAHEAQEVVPECVTGTKDAVDEDGNPIYQGIDQSKMVPLAVAAIQECIKRIEVLETELALLKNSN